MLYEMEHKLIDFFEMLAKYHKQDNPQAYDIAQDMLNEMRAKLGKRMPVKQEALGDVLERLHAKPRFDYVNRYSKIPMEMEAGMPILEELKSLVKSMQDDDKSFVEVLEELSKDIEENVPGDLLNLRSNLSAAVTKLSGDLKSLAEFISPDPDDDEGNAQKL